MEHYIANFCNLLYLCLFVIQLKIRLQNQKTFKSNKNEKILSQELVH